MHSHATQVPLSSGINSSTASPLVVGGVVRQRSYDSRLDHQSDSSDCRTGAQPSHRELLQYARKHNVNYYPRASGGPSIRHERTQLKGGVNNVNAGGGAPGGAPGGQGHLLGHQSGTKLSPPGSNRGSQARLLTMVSPRDPAGSGREAARPLPAQQTTLQAQAAKLATQLPSPPTLKDVMLNNIRKWLEDLESLDLDDQPKASPAVGVGAKLLDPARLSIMPRADGAAVSSPGTTEGIDPAPTTGGLRLSARDRFSNGHGGAAASSTAVASSGPLLPATRTTAAKTATSSGPPDSSSLVVDPSQSFSAHEGPHDAKFELLFLRAVEADRRGSTASGRIAADLQEVAAFLESGLPREDRIPPKTIKSEIYYAVRINMLSVGTRNSSWTECLGRGCYVNEFLGCDVNVKLGDGSAATQSRSRRHNPHMAFLYSEDKNNPLMQETATLAQKLHAALTTHEAEVQQWKNTNNEILRERDAREEELEEGFSEERKSYTLIIADREEEAEREKAEAANAREERDVATAQLDRLKSEIELENDLLVEKLGRSRKEVHERLLVGKAVLMTTEELAANEKKFETEIRRAEDEARWARDIFGSGSAPPLKEIFRMFFILCPHS